MTPELAGVLRRIANADATAGGHVRFRPFFIEEANGPISIEPHVDGHQELQAGPMFALQDLGYVEIAPSTAEGNEYGPFQLTAAGRNAIARFRDPAAPGADAASRTDTSWERLRHVLVAVVEEWEGRGAREPVATETIVTALAEVSHESDVRVAIDLLEQGGWLSGEFEMGTEGPIEVTPTPKALEEARGWPAHATDTAVVATLLRALDEAIERAQDPEEKTRLQTLRTAAGDVGKSVLAGAIVAAGKMAAGGS